MFIENKIKNFEKEICQILAQLAFHIHPKVVERIQRKNQEEFQYFRELFDGKIDVMITCLMAQHVFFRGLNAMLADKEKREPLTLSILPLLMTTPSHAIFGAFSKIVEPIMGLAGKSQV